MIKKILILIAIILCGAQLFAGTVGKISGFVTDKESGEPLAGVNVFIENTRLGASTDLEGEYFIINIPPGTYSVTASIIGYQKVTVTDVRVSPDRTTKVQFSLTTEIMAGETITVVADRPLIQRDVTFTETVTSADEIEKMPVTTVSEVMSINAGFIVQGYTTDPDGNSDGTESIHVRGGRSNEIVYMIDGFYVKDPHSSG
ncbi:MAG: TonB-dependent receptor, partial [Calditrichaceae bacterium]